MMIKNVAKVLDQMCLIGTLKITLADRKFHKELVSTKYNKQSSKSFDKHSVGYRGSIKTRNLFSHFFFWCIYVFIFVNTN